ncbi:MAG TPA: M48 family metallopeptidase [Chryseolinea sp.]|nr:M48 family metallopeptidase [Chryseolinea sp.]
MNGQVLSDYKKWLLYSFDNQGFDSHYDLFKAMQSTTTFGSVSVARSSDDLQNGYTISMDSVHDVLQLTDVQRVEFLRYLTANYFQTEDVDTLKQDRTRQSDRAKNHKFVETKANNYDNEMTPLAIQPHPKELTYFNIKLVVSVIIYLAIAGLLGYGIAIDKSMLFALLMFLPLILVALLLSKIMHGFFVGLIRGNSVRITKEQFPEVYEIIEQQANRLEVALPEIYITSGHFNAFVTRFSRSHILMIYSEVIETALKGNYDVLKYVTAHELCHIKQKHLLKEKYLLPSRLIPFLGLAYSRGCEYTCDRVGFQFSPQGSAEGILIMTTGKEVYEKFNIALHIENSVENEGFWTWFSEKFLTHPHLYKRLVEIKKFSGYNN